MPCRAYGDHTTPCFAQPLHGLPYLVRVDVAGLPAKSSQALQPPLPSYTITAISDQTTTAILRLRGRALDLRRG
jgi:hypothetical protein